MREKARDRKTRDREGERKREQISVAWLNLPLIFGIAASMPSKIRLALILGLHTV